MIDLRTLFGSDRAKVDGANALTAAGLDDLREVIRRAMDELPPEYEDAAGAWAVRVWLSDLLIEAAEVIRDQAAGEAEAAGESISTIGAALGQGTTGNTRRKSRFMRQFAEARKAVDLTGATVAVQAGKFLVHVTPRSSRV